MNKKEEASIGQAKDTSIAILLILLLVLVYTRNANWAKPAIAVLIIAMTWPSFFKPLARVWFGLSRIMGTIISKILLTIVFFLVATPIGLLRKVAGADAMQLKKWRKNNVSAFVDRDHSYTADDLEKPY